MIAVANDHKRVTFDTGLKRRISFSINAATGQIYQIALQNQPVSNKYQTKKAKAQTIKKEKQYGIFIQHQRKQPAGIK